MWKGEEQGEETSPASLCLKSLDGKELCCIKIKNKINLARGYCAFFHSSVYIPGFTVKFCYTYAWVPVS